MCDDAMQSIVPTDEASDGRIATGFKVNINNKGHEKAFKNCARSTFKGHISL